MGKNKKRPCGYSPALEFYLRRDREGGKLLDPGVFRGDLDALARRTCLVLVHGFNNSDSGAADAYFAFRKRERVLFAAVDPAAFDALFGDTFWPGDAQWGFFDKLDFLIYPTAVHTAIDAAKELDAMLAKLPNLERVDFIAHSLGCRVVLETILLLRKRTLPKIGRVVLMAAAIPSEMLEPGGRFFNLLMEIWAEGIEVRVLHSLDDKVLHWAFPPGQSLAGRSEASQRALGRYGPSVMMPGWNRTLRGVTVRGADHSDYWGDGAAGPSGQSTSEAGNFLRLGDLRRAVSSARDLSAPAAVSAPRSLVDGRSLPAPRTDCR
ncbi:MAG TPA: alpha/beta hydrolase [Gemmatimonadaceae bacterium]